MLPQCPARILLSLEDNEIGAEGAGILAGVLPRCLAISIRQLRLMTITTGKSRTGVHQKDEDAVEVDDEDDQDRIRSTRVDQGK